MGRSSSSVNPWSFVPQQGRSGESLGQLPTLQLNDGLYRTLHSAPLNQRTFDWGNCIQSTIRPSSQFPVLGYWNLKATEQRGRRLQKGDCYCNLRSSKRAKVNMAESGNPAEILHRKRCTGIFQVSARRVSYVHTGCYGVLVKLSHETLVLKFGYF